MKLPKFSLKKKSAKKEEAVDSPSSALSSPQPGTSSSAGAKQWIILHVEKIVLVASVVIVGLLIYSAIGTLRPDSKLTPSSLAKRANALDSKIQASGEEVAEIPPDFVAQVEAAKRRIAAGSYSFDSLTGVDAQKIRKRGRPQFLRLENLWASGGSGIFWLRGGGKDDKNLQQGAIPAQDARPGQNKPGQKPKVARLSEKILPGVRMPAGATGELKHWAAITAVLPVKDQQAIFEKNFREAEGYDQQEDIPKYLLARLQRIEVPMDVENFQPDWSQPDIEWQWGIKTPDNSPEKDISSEKASPIPTSLSRMVDIRDTENWATLGNEIVDLQYVQSGLTMPLGPLAFADWQPWATHPDLPLGFKSVAKGADRPPKFKRPTVKTGRRDANEGNQTKKKTSALDRFRTKKPTEPAARAETEPDSQDQTAPPNTINNKLVRLFDFDVQPGKTYLYRVQLLLENPNYEKSPRVLKNPPDRKWSLTPDAWLPWSEPSNPVSIPEAIDVYAGGVQNDANGDNTATIFVSQPAASGGKLQIGKKENLQQGGVVRGELTEAYAINGAGLPSKETQLISADVVLVDIRLRKDEAEATDMSELLFFDSGGRFMVRNVSEGAKQSSLYQAAAQGDANRRKAKDDSKKRDRDDGDEDKNRFRANNPESPESK